MFTMIKRANQARVELLSETDAINSNLVILAETQNQTSDVLAENVTHVLANIANAAQEGDELKLMHQNSIAAFLAGVEMLAQRLPEASPEKLTMAMRVLAAASVDPEGYVTYATTPIAQLGARSPDLMQKYRKIVDGYVQSVSRGSPDGTKLAQAARKLQMTIDRAIQLAQSSGSKNAPGETTFDPKIAAAQPAVG